jgi:dTDP-4-amino-4,6-dideoxygalactose transaminase
MINVTKTFLPPFEEYTAMLKRVWDNTWVTNNGPLLQELEQKLKDYLGVKNLLVCSNGTIVLQMALKALNITGEVITTPFSYVATTTAILWENCKPIFVDINDSNFTIDVTRIEEAITSKTQAILATHVYGHPCDVERIEEIANKYNLKVIYDGAHAFGTEYKGKSIFDYGDISTCSFHATKLFHMVEGGGLVTNDNDLLNQLFLFRQFGHIYDNYLTYGINAKNSEFHAAMGICNLNHINNIREIQQKQWLYYFNKLKSSNLKLIEMAPHVKYNYAYFPAIFSSEDSLQQALNELNENQIFPRRYFYPALNTLPYLTYQSCPVTESLAQRVICLPLYVDLSNEVIDLICQVLLKHQ